MQGETSGEGRFARLAVIAAGIGFPLAVVLWASFSGRWLEVISEPLARNGLAAGLFVLAGLALSKFTWRIAPAIGRLDAWLSGQKHFDIVVTCAGLPGYMILMVAPVFGPWLTTDSWHYLGWAAWRPAGYPLILWVTATFDPSLKLAMAAQLIATFFAALMLARTIRRLVGGPAGLAVGVMLMTSLPFLYNVNVILSDQLFICVVAAILIVALKYLEKTGLPRLAILWLLVLFAVLLRPVGVTLIVPIAFLIWLKSPGWKAAILSIAAPAVAILLLVSASNVLLFGFFRPFALGGTAQVAGTWCLSGAAAPSGDLERKLAPIGQSLCMKLAAADSEAAWFQTAQTATTEAVSSGIIATQQHIRETLPDSLVTPGAGHLRMYLQRENYRLGDAAIEGMAGNWSDGPRFWPATNDLLAEIAGRRIAAAPVEYGIQSLRRMASGWLEVIPVFSAERNLGPQTVFDIEANQTRFRRAIPADWWDFPPVSMAVPALDLLAAPGYLLVRHLFLPALVLVLGIWTLAAAIRRRLGGLAIPSALGIAAFSALFLFTYHGAVAASAVMIPRLAAPGIAPAWVVVACGLWYLLMRGSKRGETDGDRIPH
ncbi:MAG: hypothetical protein RJQ21_12275 [Rhodospirillales bacterium]